MTVPNLPTHFPEELVNTNPVSANIYNIFEKYLPTTGHLGLLVSVVLATMCIDEQRQSNLIIGAFPSEGKTSVLRVFNKLQFCNFFTRITCAQYLMEFCGLYLDSSAPLPSGELPKGVKTESIGGKKMIDKSSCVDYVNNRFDICHAGEGIFTINDFKSLAQLWNALLDERFYKGGNRVVGKYVIGSPSIPVNHGLILACTLNDLDNEWIKEEGLMSRTIEGVYHCLDVENEYIVQGRSPPKVRIRYYDFSDAVLKAFGDLSPKQKKPVSFSSDVNNKNTRLIFDMIKEGRGETTGKRAMNDRINLLKSHAVLNRKGVVTLEDVWIVESLLLFCKRNVSSKQHFFGDRLCFQTNLRLHLSDEKDVSTQLKDNFKWWDSDDPLYTEKRLNETVKLLKNHVHYGEFGKEKSEDSLVFVDS